MEMMVNNKENVKKYPQIAEAFEAYGRVRGPKTAGIFPVGIGLMRVIPIEKSIEGETRRASYEEISKYLNENDVFSVSDCSCRTARDVMGEGCGHLKEDMCIQMGHAAKYYIRTGRGREITREEAFEIIKKAEADGLVHQIPNTDGSGKTHAICNCCGCSCLSLRTAEMFLNTDMVRSNYVSKVDKDKCVGCGECVEACQVNALRLGQKICAKTHVALKKRPLPYDTEWGPDKWNPNYRLNREVVVDTGTSPCKAECPAHIGIQGYIKKAAQGKYSEALELIKNKNLKELGIEFKIGVEVGKDVSINTLRGEGFEAFYLAIGAQAGRKLGMVGEDAVGVITGVDFLRRVNLGEDTKLEGKVVVIGGGNVAIDVARTATRVGASKVDMFCLESREQMPALQEEIEEAIAEDITINNSWGPKGILKENGCVTGVEFKKCISVFDKNKRFNPKFDENDTKIVKTNYVLISVGQAMDWGNLAEDSKIELNPNKTIKVDCVTYQTGEPDVFAGGDVLIGPKFAIDAIAVGKQGAISIHRFVQPGQSLTIGRINRHYLPLDKVNLDLEGYDFLPRQKVSHVEVNKSKESFKDLRCTFTEEQVKKETERCLGCGVTVVDEYMCVGCGVCTTKCKFDAISLVRKYDGEGLELREIKPAVKKYAIKRKLRIVALKPVKFIEAIFSSNKGK